MVWGAVVSRDGVHRTRESDIDRMLDRWRTTPIPLGLTRRQTEQSGLPRHCDPVPVTVSLQVTHTWVDDKTVDGEVIAYTPKAVLVRMQLPGWTEPQEIWVWANAVERKTPCKKTTT